MDLIEIGSEGCRLQLHKTVFEGDMKTASKIIWNCDINTQDIHGNTPLHLATMLGNHELVLLLLSHGASVKIKNNLGWTPLAEAISYGNKNIVTSLLTKMQEQLFLQRQKQLPKLAEKFELIPDFEMTLQWDFHTWVPLLSRLLPSDVCTIRKKGNKIRLDSSLLDFSGSRWHQGDVTFIFTIQKNQPLIMMDNQRKIVEYHNSKTSSNHGNREVEVDFLMSHSIHYATLQSNEITFDKCYTGFFSKAAKTEKIGDYHAECYVANNLVLYQKKRREHLGHNKESSSKSMLVALQDGQINSEFIPPPSPPPCTVTWKEYIHAEPSKHHTLARPMVLKESYKHYKAYLSMSKNFPLQTNILMDLLELMAPMKHFSKLRDFLNNKLPQGFPIKVEIPIVPTIKATAIFKNFEWKNDLSDDLFTVPLDYVEALLRV